MFAGSTVSLQLVGPECKGCGGDLDRAALVEVGGLAYHVDCAPQCQGCRARPGTDDPVGRQFGSGVWWCGRCLEFALVDEPPALD